MSAKSMENLINVNFKKIPDMKIILAKAVNELPLADGKQVLAHLASKLG